LIDVSLSPSHGRLDNQLASVQEVLIEEPPQRMVWLRTTRLWFASAIKALMREDAAFNQVRGMNETSCIATMLYYAEQDPTGSVGRFLLNLDAKIVNEDRRDIIDFGVVGELCVRGPTIVKGYYDNEEANKRDWDEDGYFHMGDVAYCGKESKL
jgi:4-coumarate--CoA ligase